MKILIVTTVASALLIASGSGSENACDDSCAVSKRKFCGVDNTCYYYPDLTCTTLKDQVPGLQRVGPISCTKGNLTAMTMSCGENTQEVPVYEMCEGKDFKCYGPSDVSSEKARILEFLDNFLESCKPEERLRIEFSKFGIKVGKLKLTSTHPWAEGTPVQMDGIWTINHASLRGNATNFEAFREELARRHRFSLNLAALQGDDTEKLPSSPPTAPNAGSQETYSILTFLLAGFILNLK